MKLALLLSLLFVSILPAADAPFNVPGLKKDIEFTKAGDVSLTLDAYAPQGEGPFATCILVHGGGFTKGNKHTFITPLFEPLTKAGFVWFTIDYRLAPQHQWPACAEDVNAAIKWVKAHAAEYKVDVKRIALIGESAGGHLVSWAGVTATDETKVAAIIPFYAPHDLVPHVKRRNEMRGLGDLIGSSEMSEANFKKLEQMSPSHFVKPGLPPFLQIHGDADTTVAHEQSVQFEAKMKAAGNSCETITVPGGGHGMGGWSKLNSDYAEQMIAWVRKTLK
jgi:alpha-L-fucosidase 2